MGRSLLAGLALAAGVACGGPRAAPIGGDISSALEKGIAEGTDRFDHGAWDELVQEHVRNGGHRFDYAGLKEDESAFHAYLDSLAAAELSSLSQAEIQALLINAYNAYTVKTILDHVTEDGTYQIESIRDIPDVFSREVHTVGGYSLSLDNIEHNVLRPMFRDPRFHFAVNCASISCPPLPTRAFTGKTLDQHLDDVTRKTLRNPDYVAVQDDVLVVTKIMDWYRGDFVDPDYQGSEGTLAAYIAKYASPDVVAFIEVRGDDVPVKFRDYDWGLNRP